MIEINLLPDAYKLEKKTQEHNIPINLILLSANAVMIVTLLIVTGINVSQAITLRALNTRLDGLAPEQQKILTVQQETTSLRQTNALFSPLVTNSFSWAKKINLLSDLMMPGIWVRQIMLEKKVISAQQDPAMAGLFSLYLKIEATVVSLSHDEMGIIGDFIRNLKTNTDFFDDFKTIELEGVLRRKIGGVEVMDFTLLCSLNEGAGL